MSLPPVAEQAGRASILVWPVSALIGLVTAVVFAELACRFPGRSGGIAVIAAEAIRPKRPFLAQLVQWSYWLGWSPALAIGAALLGVFVRHELAPDSSPWFAWIVACAVLATSVVLNQRGIRACARVHVLLVAGLLLAAALLAARWSLHGDLDAGQLTPLAPPGGWGSWGGLQGLMGALFLAGWSAYGAEIALTYGPEHRAGPRAAVRSLLATGGVMVVVYSLVPILLVSTVGIDRVADDPANALGVLTDGGSIATTALLAIGIVALLLGLDTVAAADSRVLFQMARNGDAWAFLGRVNRHGAPANALAFDGAWNAALLALAVVAADGDAAAVPVVLLTAASVGYFTSLVIALATAWATRRADPDAPLAFRAPRGLMALAPVVAVLDAALVVGAGTAWGWRNVGLGVALLAGLMLVRPASARTAALARAAATR